jgi:hypothetical protein
MVSKPQKITVGCLEIVYKDPKHFGGCTSFVLVSEEDTRELDKRVRQCAGIEPGASGNHETFRFVRYGKSLIYGDGIEQMGKGSVEPHKIKSVKLTSRKTYELG